MNVVRRYGICAALARSQDMVTQWRTRTLSGLNLMVLAQILQVLTLQHCTNAAHPSLLLRDQLSSLTGQDLLARFRSELRCTWSRLISPVRRSLLLWLTLTLTLAIVAYLMSICFTAAIDLRPLTA
jgi:hypothetical protein